MAKSKYYDYNDIMSRQCMLNFVIGSRSIGKSYQMKRLLIKRFKKKKEQFVYVRQNQNQIDEIDDWVGEVADEFPDDEFLTKKNFVYIKHGTKWEKMGYMVAISAYAKIKSMDFSKVKTVVYDEFSDQLAWSGKKKIPVAFLNEVDTVVRNRDKKNGVKIFLLGNAETIDNIFFRYFKIQPDPHNEWTVYRDRGICVNIAENVPILEDRKRSDFGRLIAGTDYGDFALNNTYKDENVDNVKPLPESVQPLSEITYGDDKITVWKERKNDNVYISERLVNNLKSVAVDPNEGEASNYYKYHKEVWQVVLVRAVSHNILYYTDVSARVAGVKILQKLGIY